MATLQEIANVFNANSKRHSDGKGAKIDRRADGQYVAIFEGVEEVFPVTDDAPAVRLNTHTQEPANHAPEPRGPLHGPRLPLVSRGGIFLDENGTSCAWVPMEKPSNDGTVGARYVDKMTKYGLEKKR